MVVSLKQSLVRLYPNLRKSRVFFNIVISFKNNLSGKTPFKISKVICTKAVLGSWKI